MPERNQGQFNAYVMSAPDKAERTRRRAEAPESMREGITNHVRTVLTLQKKSQDNKK